MLIGSYAKKPYGFSMEELQEWWQKACRSIFPNAATGNGRLFSEENLRPAIGETHRRYIRRINCREGWRVPGIRGNLILQKGGELIRSIR